MTAREDWTSKSGGIQWAPSHANPLLCSLGRDSRARSVYCFYLTDDILNIIMDNTNLHGQGFVQDWTDIESTDLSAYISVSARRRMYRSRDEAIRSLRD